MLPEFDGFDALLQRSKVLMKDRHGVKVIATPEGLIMKLFRRKRLLSSALWNPYALRFSRNAARLTELGIPTVEVTGVWRISSLKRHIVAYRRLEGECFRDLDKTQARMENLAAFVAQLHQKGVFFRSIHFGNILELPDGRFALIDMADLTFRKRPLTAGERLRNLGHLAKYDVDRRALQDFGIERFITLYRQAAGGTAPAGEVFERAFAEKLGKSAG